ncbi:MAG: hypothetical protein A2X88_07095 [Deltaproteobacteria bacterium GWC2_65_14]|nr:MAG: hypothetical protein A2X88_07095 [Deltaproteobacteria bacterium GWC2_65_14]
MKPNVPVRTWCVLVAAILILPLRVTAAALGEGTAGGTSNRGLLDGRVFVVERGEAGRQADGKDTLIFRNGRFLSASCEKGHGFGDGAYTSSERGGDILFAADIRSDTQGTIHWEGTVRGDRIDVQYTWAGKPKWYRSNPSPTVHWARSVTEWGMKDPGPPGGGAVSHLLDGKTFHVKAGEQGKGADHDDYLIFQDGMFTSSGCVESWNFRNAAYSATAEDGGIRFLAQLVSTTHGTLTWDGTVRGDAVDATARWVHEKWYWTIDREYWYRGSRVE